MKIPYLSESVIDLDRCIKVVFDKPPTAAGVEELIAAANESRPIALTIGYDYFPTSNSDLNLSYLGSLSSLQ